MPLKLPKQLLAEMISHALEQDPEECCGILLGKGENATRLRRVRNANENRISRYNMDPLDVLEVERDADSHTYSQGYPSDTDVKNAVETGWTDPYYVLVSLVEKTRPVVRAYRISDTGEVVEQFIHVRGAGGYTSGSTRPQVVE